MGDALEIRGKEVSQATAGHERQWVKQGGEERK